MSTEDVDENAGCWYISDWRCSNELKFVVIKLKVCKINF